MRTSSIWRAGLTAALALAVMTASGCGDKNAAKKNSDIDVNAEVKQLIQSMQETPQPYKGNLTPEKAAEITNAVATQSMAEVPSGKTMPKDPKELTAINDRIRARNDQIYAKYGTTFGEFTRYLTDLSLKDRETYNAKLTELFMGRAKAEAAAQPANQAPVVTPAPSAKNTPVPAPKKK